MGVLMRRHLAAILLALAAFPAAAEVTGEIGGECVPFARRMSGVQIWGDAWTWWDQADGRYERGRRAQVGAVLVFRPSGPMRLGHVSVVSRVIDPRIVMVTHSNWSRIGGTRGQVERDVTMTDVSPGNDWSEVKVWYNDNDGLGGRTYPTYGFIYGRPAAGSAVSAAKVSAALTGVDPDIVGSIIDVVR